MQLYTVYLYLETVLHVSGGFGSTPFGPDALRPYVSGGTSTHHQEHMQLYLQHLVFVTLLLLPAAFVEEVEFQFLHDSGR